MYIYIYIYIYIFINIYKYRKRAGGKKGGGWLTLTRNPNKLRMNYLPNAPARARQTGARRLPEIAPRGLVGVVNVWNRFIIANFVYNFLKRCIYTIRMAI